MVKWKSPKLELDTERAIETRAKTVGQTAGKSYKYHQGIKTSLSVRPSLSIYIYYIGPIYKLENLASVGRQNTFCV